MTHVYLGYQTDEHSIRTLYEQLYAHPPEFIACDTETFSVQNRGILNIAFVLPDMQGFCFDWLDPELPLHWLMLPTVKKLWHNPHFDLGRTTLGQYGVDLDNIEDSATLCRLANIPAELSEAARYLRLDQQTDSVRNVLDDANARGMSDLTFEQRARKCIQDARVSMRLWQELRPRVSDSYYTVEIGILRKLLKQSRRGFRVDPERVAAIDAELERGVESYIGSARALGFNPLSPKQVAYMLQSEGIWVPFKHGVPDTSEEALAEIEHPWAALTIAARKYNKLHGTYTHPLVGQQRAYSRFGTEAATGRITSSAMNLHNIPTGRNADDIKPRAGSLRSMFVPDTGEITRLDMSQIEMRIAAHLSQDATMLDVLNNPPRLADGSVDKERDIHGITRNMFHLIRDRAKNFNFWMLFGGDEPGTARKYTGINATDSEIVRYRQAWLERYPQLAAWIREQQYTGLRELKVQTLYGRTLRLDWNEHEQVSEAHIRKMAVNYPIQGSAAEVFKRLMLELDHSVPESAQIVQVHDEVLLDGHYELDWQQLAYISPLWTPVEVKHLERWG